MRPTGKIVGNIQLGGVPEFPVSDEAGNIYVNIDDKSDIVQVDSTTLEIKAHWPLTPCKSPSGLAIDTKAHRLFAACDNKLLAVVNADTGRLVSTLPIGDGADAAAFDPRTGTIFSSNGDGTLTIIKSIGNDRYEVVQNLATEKGARTMALDSKTGAVYLSTAKLGPPPAPTPQNPNPPSHPTAIAGSFKVLVAVSK
jgi:outer membrane protein assembly factor BamB